MLNLAETPLAGLERGFYQVTEAALDFSRFTEDAVVGVFGKLEDTIASFVTTGRLNFRSFVTDISAMLVKLATNQALQFLFNAAGSALFSGFAPRTTGGSATGFSVPSFNLAPGGFRPIAAAEGASFEVSSRIGMPRAGRDNRFVPMYLRDGEQVDVTPRGQRPNRGGTVVNMTVYANDAGSFRNSQDQIVADLGRRLNRAQRNE
jgi:phage-related minor tail protein